MRSRTTRGAAALEAFADIVGRKNVLTSTRATARYVAGQRYGGGHVLAVVRPATLVEMWLAFTVCVDHDLIVIPQSANTGLTGGSGPGDQEYDREIVIISTLRIDQIHLINDAREAVCLAGSTLYALEEVLQPHAREPHSVIGSTAIGASVVGGIANNSGGSQVRKGPAFTEQAIYARVDESGKAELINHLGIELGDDPLRVLERVQQGDWGADDVTPPPAESRDTAYSDHVRQIVGTPARYNADPKFLREASGSAGKVLIFAVRTRTFPRDEHTTTFYIGTNSPSELEKLRRMILRSGLPLPVSAEYMGRSSFDLAEEFGKDTFVALRYAGSRQLQRMFALKIWANRVLGTLPSFGPNFADKISQWAFGLLPSQLPQRMLEYRDRFEHHLIMVVSDTERAGIEALVASFFSHPGRNGKFFVCSATEARSAMLHRFGAASAMTRFFTLHRERFSDLITFDVALRRDDDDWLEVLPPEIADQLVVSSYYGHFFCHVLHQDHVVKRGADPVELKKRMTALLEERGAAMPAEHNYGRLYQAPSSLVAHYRRLDPHNVLNAGVGCTSARRDWT